MLLKFQSSSLSQCLDDEFISDNGDIILLWWYQRLLENGPWSFVLYCGLTLNHMAITGCSFG